MCSRILLKFFKEIQIFLVILVVTMSLRVFLDRKLVSTDNNREVDQLTQEEEVVWQVVLVREEVLHPVVCHNKTQMDHHPVIQIIEGPVDQEDLEEVEDQALAKEEEDPDLVDQEDQVDQVKEEVAQDQDQVQEEVVEIHSVDNENTIIWNKIRHTYKNFIQIKFEAV